MKDIDFDELDKAVNSLMATASEQTSPEPTAQAAPTQAPNDLQPSSATTSTSTAATPPVAMSGVAPQPASATAGASVPVSVRSTPPAPANRRSGRFMDMVHSSSEMKPRAETSAASREGLSITPRPDTEQQQTPTAPVLEATEDTQSVITPTPLAMPDPIDMISVESEPSTTVESVSTVELEEPIKPDVMTMGSVESPFLSDAKVEKRPLNAGTGDAPLDLMREDAIEETPSNETTSSAPVVETEDQNETDEPPLSPQVPELSSDLVAIESSENTNLTQAVETTDVASQVDAPTVPLGPASIAQQYKPQPSTGDQSHAAIYDASQYPEPLAHPAKSKSGWLWVLWVVLLLGVGAGGAFLLYNLGIIP